MIADADGRISLTFTLPPYYVPDYDVTATGPVSGIATTTFTDAASGSWRYWMTAPTPGNNGNVAPAETITYVLNAQKTNTSSNGFTDAVMTLTLTGDAVFTGPTTPLAANLGSITGIGTNTLRWTGMNLNRVSGSNITRSLSVTATVSSLAGAGTVIARAADDNDPNGVFYTGGSRLDVTTHNVTGPVVNTCDFATPGSGAYANSICWFDLTGYNATTATSTNGQTMRQNLPGGYTLTYTIRASGTTVTASTLPTWSGAYLGNTASGVGGYYGISGRPALYQTGGGTTTLTLTNITLRTSSGTSVTGFALVGADAESSDSGESITWTSSNTLESIGTLGNACGGTSNANPGSLVWSNGNRTARCNGRQDGATKTGTAILYSQDPSTFTQEMYGGGLQAVAFGVMVSGIQLKKAVVNPVSAADGFTISVTPSGQTSALGSATANAGSNWTADTGQLHWIASGSNQTFTMTETAVGPTDSGNYAVTWACTKNGQSFTPTGSSDTSKTATLAFGDFIVCTITNTGPLLTLTKRVDNAAGGSLTPASWTLSATKSGSPSAISEAPTRNPSTSGSVATASTATVAVPVGAYVLSEASTATGAGEYDPSAWTCTNAGTGTFTLSGSDLTMRAGNSLTCTITNTHRRTVSLRKTWVNGVNGDRADLVINNATTSPGRTTSTSNGASGSWTDTANVATAMPAVGSSVTVAEVMQPTNVGGYASGLACVDGNNAAVTVSSGRFTMPNSNVTCTFTNTAIWGTVTWSKVDAGSTTTLLKGSEWTLTGPSYPAPGTTVTDCAASPCVGPDTDPVVGQFSVAVRYGTYTLVEKTAPVGFQLDPTPRTFSITTNGQIVAVGAVSNKRALVPALPLTGGAASDAFVLSGLALLTAAGIAGGLHRRRSLRSLRI